MVVPSAGGLGVSCKYRSLQVLTSMLVGYIEYSARGYQFNPFEAKHIRCYSISCCCLPNSCNPCVERLPRIDGERQSRKGVMIEETPTGWRGSFTPTIAHRSCNPKRALGDLFKPNSALRRLLAQAIDGAIKK